jgi:predicted HTH transcriptional regulator
MSIISETVRQIIAEANVQKMGRKKLVRIRIRKGKVQRRKMVSAVKGYTIRGGKLTRMPAKERLKRKISARKAKIKRRAKLARALIKRKRSLRKRAALGLK